MAIKLIIGLCNPGLAYKATRHNAGAWFTQACAGQHAIHFKLHKKFYAEVCELRCDSLTCILALPVTFMNLSGQPTHALSQFYRIHPHEILVVHDELDLQPGRIKFKTGGGHGGHNGLRDIIRHLGSADFHRLRIGIGHPGHKDLVHQYVLGKPSIADKQQMDDAIARATALLPLIIAGELAKVMNQLNS